VLELEHFDDVFSPADVPTGIEGLPDGEHVFTIQTADVTTVTTRDGQTVPVVRWLYRTTDGRSIEMTTWLRDARSINLLGAELGILGVPVREWKKANGKPFSKMLPDAVSLLPGVAFRGVKTTNDKGLRVYHNLKIVSVVDTGNMPMPMDKLPF